VIISYWIGSILSVAATTLGAVSFWYTFRTYRTTGTIALLGIALLSLPLGIVASLAISQQRYPWFVNLSIAAVFAWIAWELWLHTGKPQRGMAILAVLVLALSTLQTAGITWQIEQRKNDDATLLQKITDNTQSQAQNLQQIAERQLADAPFRAAWAAGQTADLQAALNDLTTTNRLQRAFLANGLGDQVITTGTPKFEGNILQSYPWIIGVLEAGKPVTGYALDPTTQQPVVLSAVGLTTDTELRAILVLQKPLDPGAIAETLSSGSIAAVSAVDTGFGIISPADQIKSGRILSATATAAYAARCKAGSLVRFSLGENDQITPIACTRLETLHSSNGIVIITHQP
jgi:hypothetical protein